MDRTPGCPARPLALVVAGLVLWTGSLSAQRADFLFQRPSATISFFGGWSMPTEQSDIFDHTRELLTVERGDFAAPVLGAELAVRLTDRLEGALSVERVRAMNESEDREYIGTDNLPIEQVNELGWTRASLSGRFYLTEPGRTLGRHAWVPNRWAPFVGGGGGLVWYAWDQEGEFVDYQTLEIIPGRLATSGRGGSAHALAGVDVSVTPRVVLRGEFRYHWSSAEVGGSFRSDFQSGSAFDDIDLGGPRGTVALTFRL